MPEAPFEKHQPHPWKQRLLAGPHAASPPRAAVSYAELAVTSNFTFLTGASHPEELVRAAAAMGHACAAIADLHTLAGVVRAHVAAKEAGIGLAVGARVSVRDGPAARQPDNTTCRHSSSCLCASVPLCLLLYPTDRLSYGGLCRLLTTGKRRAPKGECHLDLHDVIEHHDGLLCVVVPPRLEHMHDDYLRRVEALARCFAAGDRLSIAACRDYGPDDHARLAQIDALCHHVGVPMVAVNDVLYHDPSRKPLQDVLTCIRHGCTLDQAGLRLEPGAERSLKPPEEMARLFDEYPCALARAADIALRSARGFSLDQLKYEYPDEVVPHGRTPMQHLADLVWQGAGERLVETTKRPSDEPCDGATEEMQTDTLSSSFAPPPPSLRRSVAPSLLHQLIHELRLIDELNYASYFLTVHDLVRFARSRGILCQGRGAAANSAVCYCLGVTSVDPTRIDMLFERFISKERDEPPDIDIDFEHERREEVIQYIYGKYGRDRAALTAEVITYRGRSAIREVGKALGLSLDCVDRLAKQLDWWERGFAGEDGENQDSEERRKWEKENAHRTSDRSVKAQGGTGGSPARKSTSDKPHPDTWLGDHPRREPQWPSPTDGPRSFPPTSPSPSRHALARDTLSDRLRDLGINPDDPTIRLALRLAGQILGFPRHLSQHVGGFVMTRGPLCECVPIENARMPDRTVIEWDKDDIEAVGMLKVDVLGLGMLSAISKALVFVNQSVQRASSAFGPEGATICCRGWSEEASGRRAEPPESPPSSFSPGGAAVPHATQSESVAQVPLDIRGHGVVAKGLRRGISDQLSESEPPSPLRGSPISPPLTGGSAHPAPQDSLHPRLQTAAPPGLFHRRIAPSPAPLPSSLGRLMGGVAPSLALHTIPPEDPHVYDMICRADTVGVFQIESRAQMSMLPRLRPRNFYDLVIEVAIVRPGPIVGDMVHPYLKRRNGEEKVEYPDEAVKAVLGKTLGVPLFQEQAMKLAMVAAGFTAGEADQLRRAIAAWKTKQKVIYTFGKRIIEGMVSRGYQREFAERCFEQLKGFSEYGFPESHAASFALLVYASSWLKCYYPAEFAAALINSQPMGFYAPAQIVRDAREHGVDVRPIDVNISGWECSIESDEATERPSDGGQGSDAATKRRSDDGGGQERASATQHLPSPPSLARSVAPSLPPPPRRSTTSLRLGLRLISGLSEAEARRIERAVAARGPFASITALWRTSGVKVSTLRRLAHADAFGSMRLDRQHALWQVRALKDEHLPLFDQQGMEAEDIEAHRHEDTKEDAHASSPPSLARSVSPSLPPLPPLSPARHVLHDYQSTGLSLKAHPVSFMRDHLADLRVSVNAALRDQQRFPHGASVAVAGVVLVRQRPGTASGVVFMTIEDETGVANLIVWPKVYQQFRRAARHSVIIIARGRVQRDGEVVHVLVRSIEDAGDNLAALEARSRDFR